MLGLEVHVELSTATKMFCGCANTFGAEPNTQVCPVCLGLPGSLPVLNEAAVESAIRIGLALNCEIVAVVPVRPEELLLPGHAEELPDLAVRRADRRSTATSTSRSTTAPPGASRSSARTWRRTPASSPTWAARPAGSRGRPRRCIDYNRAGVPLIEIVTKPIEGTGERAPEIARAYVTALRDLLRALGVSDVRMDQGSMRCDANVSLKPKGATEFGTRTETKNVNSLKSVEVAVRYEMRRQAAVLDVRRPGSPGDQALPRGRLHHHRAAARRPRRTTATFPSPTWSRSRPPAELVERLRGTIPELPWLRRKRIQQDWGISDEVMRDLVNAGAIDLVAATVEQGASSEAARAWWGNFLVQKANEAGVELDELPITPDAGRRGGQAGRRRQAVEQAGPPGHRGRAGRRGRTRRR